MARCCYCATLYNLRDTLAKVIGQLTGPSNIPIPLLAPVGMFKTVDVTRIGYAFVIRQVVIHLHHYQVHRSKGQCHSKNVEHRRCGVTFQQCYEILYIHSFVFLIVILGCARCKNSSKLGSHSLAKVSSFNHTSCA